MEKHLTPEGAFKDFFDWIRQPDQTALWKSIGRQKQQYIYRAEIHRKQGQLGDVRIKTILEDIAPGRYEFREYVILKDGT